MQSGVRELVEQLVEQVAANCCPPGLGTKHRSVYLRSQGLPETFNIAVSQQKSSQEEPGNEGCAPFDT